jgi:hypothetical protein
MDTNSVRDREIIQSGLALRGNRKARRKDEKNDYEGPKHF